MARRGRQGSESRWSARRSGRAAGLVAGLVLVLSAGLLVPPAAASTVRHPVVVNRDPGDSTPHALDGAVHAIAQVGPTVVAGGSFTAVRAARSPVPVARHRLLAFTAGSGAIAPRFAPVLDGEVTAVVPAADGRSVYVGGAFTTVNGVRSRGVARIALADGRLVAGFTPPALDGTVRDLALVGGRLLLAGTFTTVGGVPRAALAAVAAGSGARDDSVALGVAGPLRGGVLSVTKLARVPGGSRLVAIGNFSVVAGARRVQIAVLDLGPGAARLAPWTTRAYEPDCAPAFQGYLRDVDVAPDGGWFVVVTSGGVGPPGTLCDTAARFPLAAGADVRPTWVDATGGDTLTSVAVTGPAVYVGGHQRWHNNPGGDNSAGPGAVARSGIAALDPRNGLPLTWDPGRDRGVGVGELLATPAGLWVGSDTDRLGGELHGKLGFFPVAGGTAVPVPGVPALPGTVFAAGDPLAGPPGPRDAVLRRRYDGGRGTAPVAAPGGGVPWQDARGAVLIGGVLYTGWADGSLTARTASGSGFGPATRVELRGLTGFAEELRATTGMYYENGRLYYTVAGSPGLHYRGFSPQSRVVGATRFDVTGASPGVAWGQARGMFRAGGALFVAAGDGRLWRVPVVGGVPTGPPTLADPGATWGARALWYRAG